MCTARSPPPSGLSDAFTLINERIGSDALELFETVKNATLVEVARSSRRWRHLPCP